MGKLTKLDQEEEYRRLMGGEALDRQKRLASIEKGECVCVPRKIKRHWDGPAFKALIRTVHDRDCPKFKQWMEEA